MWTLAHVQWALVRAVVHTTLYIRTSPWLSPTTQPDHFKNYACRPNLYPCRIFIPNQDSSDGKKDALPLVIRVHGGGVVVNYPATDDILARRLVDQARCVVVSIDYSKSPQAKFPTAYEDEIAQALAAIEDPVLPINRYKVILCDSSAGGNLVLGAAQDLRLRSKILGIVAIYPGVDFGPDCAARMATRPDPSVPDFIGKSWDTIQNLHILSEADERPSMQDVRLSPTFYTTRDSLPRELLLIGAEHDMFCHELEVMADELAGDSERVESDAGWTAPGVQYYKVYGQAHAFEGFPAKGAAAERARVAATEALFDEIARWLTETSAKVGKGR